MNIVLYGSTVLVGAGGSTLLVTSLSMVADLIGCTVVSFFCMHVMKGKVHVQCTMYYAFAGKQCFCLWSDEFH